MAKRRGPPIWRAPFVTSGRISRLLSGGAIYFAVPSHDGQSSAERFCIRPARNLGAGVVAGRFCRLEVLGHVGVFLPPPARGRGRLLRLPLPLELADGVLADPVSWPAAGPFCNVRGRQVSRLDPAEHFVCRDPPTLGELGRCEHARRFISPRLSLWRCAANSHRKPGHHIAKQVHQVGTGAFQGRQTNSLRSFLRCQACCFAQPFPDEPLLLGFRSQWASARTVSPRRAVPRGSPFEVRPHTRPTAWGPDRLARERNQARRSSSTVSWATVPLAP